MECRVGGGSVFADWRLEGGKNTPGQISRQIFSIRPHLHEWICVRVIHATETFSLPFQLNCFVLLSYDHG